MSATMQPGRALRAVAQGRASAIVLQEGRPALAAPDIVEVAACELAVRAELARPGCSDASLAEHLKGLGFPPLVPAWGVLWSAERRGSLASAFAEAGVAPLAVLERLTLSAPAHSMRSCFAGRIAGEASADEVLWIADHLAEHGSWREVELVLGLTRVDAPWLGLDPALLHDRVESALVAILARDPMAYGALRFAVAAAPAEFGPAALDALAEMRGDRALATLAEWLDLRKLDVAAVLGAVEAVGRRSLPPFDEFLLQRLRELAASEDPRVRGAALRASGALGDEDSLPLQIGSLAETNGGVRSAAGAALSELTGLRFGNDAQRWLSWHGSEVEWWDESAPGVFERLTDDDTAVAIAALAEIVPHRLYRGRSSQAVAGLLDDESPELRRLACLTIEQLGGRVVALDVLERLADVDDSVRESAQRCLSSLFGLELPPELEAWKSYLERSDLVLR